MRGGQQGRFGGASGVLFVDDASAVQHQHAVADQSDLCQFAGVEHDRGALRRQLAQQRVNFMFGLNVDPPCRVKAEQGAKTTHEPAAEHDLLLIAAGEAPHLCCGARVDRQLFDRAVDFGPFVVGKTPPACQLAKEGRRQIVLHRLVGQQGNHPVAWHQHDAPSDCVVRRSKMAPCSVHPNFSGGRLSVAGEQIEEALLPLSFERHQAKNFARAHRKGDLLDQMACGEAAHLQERVAGGSFAAAGGACRFERCPEHGLDQLVFGDVCGGQFGHIASIAQNGGLVADVHHLGQAVGDEHCRLALFFPVVQQRKDAFCLLCGQRGGQFIEQEHMWLARDGTHQIHDAQRFQRQLAHQRGQVQLFQRKPGQFGTKARHVDAAEAQVLGHSQVGDQGWVLEDCGNSGMEGVGRGSKADAASLYAEDPLVCRLHAGQNFDQGAFSGAVGSQQRVDFAAVHGQIDAAQCCHRPVGLGDALCGEQ